MDKYNILKLENQLCFRLYASSREVIKKYKPILDQYNLTYTQYLTMLVLWENEKITVKGIGKKLHLDSGTLTPLIKKLEKMNLVTKYRSKEDDRVVIVELTDEGRKLKDDMIDVPRKAFCSLGIEKEQILELKKNLDSLLEILK
ncbi:MarR family winged helix-turn-helix transcriptional regulator [Clostridium perfringens]|uniref:MarR family winged helix-turn-helix transcriptional regulator n=1 Tax=Clostridium perfringens TaxID=1502 RepID=UPI001A32C3FC|nr:MarR family transcriptional regulator [Clostridium perfringens]HAT4106823.1 MarR family transcriptional regulator [Clostridium perfringens]HAT4359240.1 MarR family transcriptional regulator [Clostridium perfringens]